MPRGKRTGQARGMGQVATGYFRLVSDPATVMDTYWAYVGLLKPVDGTRM